MRFVLVLFLFLIIATTPVSAQAPRLATCDRCGYCQGGAAPDNWRECAACLYPTPAANSAGPTANKTLEISLNSDSNVEEAPTPYPGNYYTMVGCVSTDLNDFTKRTAAGSVVETLFNVLFSMGGGVALLYLIYGSFLVLTSQADPEKLDHGRRTIYGAIVGIVFIAVSVLLIKTIGVNFLRIPGFGAGS